MRRFDAVVFDMDGVLIDSEPIHYGVLSTLLAADAFALTPEENEDFIGATSEAMFATLIARHDLPRSVPEYISMYDTALVHVLAEPHSPPPGVVPLIDVARAQLLKVGLASSSRRSWIDATLRSLALSTAFDVIVSGDDVRRGKPDPEIYTVACARLNLVPSRCLAIEDSPNGVASARAAGMSVIGVRTPSTAHLSLDGALAIVDSLADLDLNLTLTS